MKRGNLFAVIGACACAAGLVLLAFPSASVSAEEPPAQGCQAVTKQEYDSAKKQRLNRAASLLVWPRVGLRQRL